MDHPSMSGFCGPFVASQIRLDAVGGETCKVGLPALTPETPDPRSAIARNCDLCGRATDDLRLACPDCIEKSAHFNEVAEESAAVHELEAQMKALDANRTRLAGLLLTLPHMTVGEIADLLRSEAAL
jgi:hypothetical protein